LNTDAASFASIFVAIIALLSSIFFYQTHGIAGASITIIVGILWIGLAYYYKKSNRPKDN